MGTLDEAVDWLAALYRMRRRRSGLVDAHVRSLTTRCHMGANLLQTVRRWAARLWAGRPGRQTSPAGWLLAAACLTVAGTWGYVATRGLRVWGGDTLANRGVFGDSFGELGALYTGLALIAAGVAGYYQIVALGHERAKTARDGVESRFFQLLASFQAAVNATRRGANEEGRQAIRKYAYVLTVEQVGRRATLGKGVGVTDEARQLDIDQWFARFFDGEYDADGREVSPRHGDLLAHLLRLMYHTVTYVTRAAVDPDDRQFYVRVLRAHLSNPELVLLLYNGLSRYGYPRMFEVIEEHDLLQNVELGSLSDVDDALLYPSLRRRVADFKAGPPPAGVAADRPPAASPPSSPGRS